MAEDKRLDEIFTSGPESEVWSHLYSGIDLAEMELDRLSPQARTFLSRFAEKVFSQRTELTEPPDDGFADLAQKALEVPWLKFAADLEFAYQAIGHAQEALKRYVELQPILTRYQLSPLASKCLRERRAGPFSFLSMPHVSRSAAPRWNKHYAMRLLLLA